MAARPEAVGTAGILTRRSDAREADRRRAFDQIFTEFWHPVTRHVECYLGDQAQVHELVAEVFQVAWTRLRVVRARGLTWLLATADQLLRERRRQGTIQDAALDVVHKNLVTSDAEVTTLERRDVLHALSMLREPERRVIVLKYWDELSDDEIGAVMRSSTRSVQSRLRRARERLRQVLAERGSGDGPR